MSDAEDNVDDEYTIQYYDVNKSILLVLIDLKDTPENRKIFANILDIYVKLMEEIIFTRYHQTMAIYWTGQDKILMEFTDDLIDSIKSLTELRKSTDDHNWTLKKILPFHKAFARCTKMIPLDKKSNPNIVIVTDEPEPEDKQYILDLKDSMRSRNVTIWLYPTSSSFDAELFYNELIDTQVPDDVNVYRLLRELCHSRVHVRKHFFELTNDRDLGFFVQTTKLFGAHKLHHKSKISRKTGNEVVEECELGAGVNFKQFQIQVDVDKFLTFDDHEKLAPYGFKLLYLTKSTISMHYINKQPFLVEPDETEGSPVHSMMFKYIWEHCKEHNLVLICTYYTAGPMTQPRLHELAPIIFNDRECFEATCIAYKPEVEASQPTVPKCEISSYEMKALESIVDKLVIDDFSIEMINDEKYQKKAEFIKAELFGREVKTDLDKVPSNIDVQNKLVGVDLTAAKECFADVEVPKKRKAEGPSRYAKK